MIRPFALIVVLLLGLWCPAQKKIVVFQSDFGVKDGAVSEMKGVAMGVSTELRLFDLTHEIPAFNIWEAAYRLQQTVPYWPAGTVFVSVVDPGVGTSRKSVVLLTKTGQYIVTPDNGTLTLIAETQGIGAIREIDETVNRRQESKKSYTFHGRDVYAYTAARLAAGVITFEQVGPLLAKQEVVALPYQHAVMEGATIKGTIPVLDVQYGNVWTNIPGELFQRLGVSFGAMVAVRVLHGGQVVYQGEMPYTETFGAVAVGKPLAYLNSLLQLSFALNQGNFAAANGISSGGDWTVEVRKKL
ncbi:SAM hydrolase/SAM-dependent halogenase family protein [Puia dinghuensis]|uniref:SAM hydrolase/SAM-dependent halogenase family protein n=1 Tax=Puia dinghuensis TaxID=1792502 RepID=UPI00166577D6|nr:S-adenosyl-l-methionine hydroxide adenosyltransferase family protein [Puia dinghuensis]